MKSNTHPTTHAMAQALIGQCDPGQLVELAQMCDLHGQDWRGWVIEHLAMTQGRWRNGALDALEPLILASSHALTPDQARHLIDQALDGSEEPDLRVLGLLKQMGHPLGEEPSHAVRCAQKLAQGKWLPPTVLMDGLFCQAQQGLYVSQFFREMLRPDDRTIQMDLLQMQRIERTGMFGTAEFIQPLASAIVGHRTRDFLQWDDFIETGNFEAGLVWLIEREWVRADLVREAIENATPRVLNSDVEGPLLEMMTREQARVLQGKMRRQTPLLDESCAPGKAGRRF